MTAEEMFKELGFTYTKVKDFITYEKIVSIHCTIFIHFDDDEKVFWSEFQLNGEESIYEINIREFKAIQKQLEELGWN